MLSKITFTPQAPGSATFSFFKRSLSTYALLPAFASRFLVFSAAAAAALTAFEKSDDENVCTKAARGSTRVRDGGRARVYENRRSRAYSRAEAQTFEATSVSEMAAEERP